MKNIRMFRVYISFAVIMTIITSSCTQGLDERQKLFLDYAKLEDKYHGTGYYHNFELYDLNTNAPVYLDSTFNSADLKSKLLKNIKLIDIGRNFRLDVGDLELQYPHQFVLLQNKNGSVNTKFSVFVPDTYYKFSVDKKDIGKTILKDSVAITLLEMTNDGVTLLVENTANRQSYDYTFDSFDQKDLSEKKRFIQPKPPGYHQNLFHSESVESPNSSRTNAQDSLVREDFSRLNITLSDQTGKTLVSEGSVNDFRHYLWYRNNDMPYPELASEYYDIKQKYKELDKDSLHKFHPIYIVTLRASGKVGKVDFFLRSEKGRVESLDLGDLIPQHEIDGPNVLPTEEMLPITNITKAEVSKLLKINCTKVSGKNNEPDDILLYASLPYGYNNKFMRLSFSDMKLIGEAKDTVDVNDYEDGNDYFKVGYNNQRSNLTAVKISPKLPITKKVIGKINLSISNYYDKIFTPTNLPKWIKMGADGATLSYYNNDPSKSAMVEFWVFGKQGGAKPLDIIYQQYDQESYLVINKYTEKITKIILRHKKDDGFNEEIPFELETPQGKKRN